MMPTTPYPAGNHMLRVAREEMLVARAGPEVLQHGGGGGGGGGAGAGRGGGGAEVQELLQG